MFGIKFKSESKMQRVKSAADKGSFRNVAHGAASLRKDVISTIESAPHGVPSEPGTPPHTHRRNFFRRAVIYSVAENKKSAVIGPRFSAVGTVGKAHEFGGSYKSQTFPKRSFMGPGLERAAPRFAGSFAGSIGD